MTTYVRKDDMEERYSRVGRPGEHDYACIAHEIRKSGTTYLVPEISLLDEHGRVLMSLNMPSLYRGTFQFILYSNEQNKYIKIRMKSGNCQFCP